MHLFFCPELEPGLVDLPEEEAHHATQVLRLTVGHRIGLLNGRGTRAEAELVDVSKKRCVAMVLESTQHPTERSALIHLAVAPTKQMDRFEWFVEKAVEIGIDRITPLQSQRTERARLRTERLERVAIAAMKQSQRVWLPAIDGITTLEDLLREAHPSQRFFGWCMDGPVSLMDQYEASRDALVLIGPEGDFTPAEAEQLQAAGVLPVSLGSARLRTETAALAACMWMSLAQQG
ncbi:MAG: 16S rRNA (uracil(1498)-N(3))-methyltransferase [Flavobacteriales bacterium]|nr:16S rRNA (uracil(1498)-N(3))-methyltransferase [Flavobacteriales bacterium]